MNIPAVPQSSPSFYRNLLLPKNKTCFRVYDLRTVEMMQRFARLTYVSDGFFDNVEGSRHLGLSPSTCCLALKRVWTGSITWRLKMAKPTKISYVFKHWKACFLRGTLL